VPVSGLVIRRPTDHLDVGTSVGGGIYSSDLHESFDRESSLQYLHRRDDDDMGNVFGLSKWPTAIIWLLIFTVGVFVLFVIGWSALELWKGGTKALSAGLQRLRGKKTIIEPSKEGRVPTFPVPETAGNHTPQTP